MIDLSTVQIVNGPPDVFAWPATAQISECEFRPGSIHLRYSHETVWPPVAFGEAQQQATLWFFGRINGQWYAAGMERLRPNQQDKPEGDDPLGFVPGLVEGRDFGPFNGAHFRPGDPCGIMVVAGDTRLGNRTVVRERTRVVEYVYPPNGQIVWTEGDPVVAPAPPDPSAPPTPPASTPTADVQALSDKLDALLALVTGFVQQPPPSYTGKIFGTSFDLRPK